MKNIALTLLLAMALVLNAGCVTRYQGASNPRMIHADQYDAVYDAALAVFDDMRWPIDEAAYNRGVISAGPKPVPGLLEPFSMGNTSNRNQLRATINDERAIARVILTPVKDNKKLFTMRVEVVIERLSEPLKRLSGTTQGHGIFSKLSTVPTEWQVKGIQAKYWNAVDRDEDLEQLILHEMMSKVLKAAPAE